MLRAPEEVSEFVVSGEGGVFDIGLQPQHVAQTGFGEPDDVVSLSLVPVTLPNSGLLVIALLRSSLSTIEALGAPTLRFGRQNEGAIGTQLFG